MRSLIGIELYRIPHPVTGDQGDASNGFFLLPLSTGVKVAAQVSNGWGWDHVSVSLPDRCPTWSEMKQVKEIFFEEDEAAIMIYPPKKMYRNLHPYCLHWWRPQHEKIPLPYPGMIA